MDLAIKDAPVIDALNTIITKHGRWGFGLCFDRLRNQGYPWNHKKVWRVYKDMKLKDVSAPSPTQAQPVVVASLPAGGAASSAGRGAS